MIFWRPVYARAIRIAFSLVSAPPSVKNVFSIVPGQRLASFSPRRARVSYAMNGEMYGSVSACFAIASSTRLSPCPMFTPISCELKSR